MPIPKENGTSLSDQTGPTKRNQILTIYIPYISLSEGKQGSEPVCPKRNGKYRSDQSEETKMDLSICLPTNFRNLWHKGKHPLSSCVGAL